MTPLGIVPGQRWRHRDDPRRELEVLDVLPGVVNPNVRVLHLNSGREAFPHALSLLRAWRMVGAERAA